MHYSFVVELNLDKGRPMHKCVVSLSATITTAICMRDGEYRSKSTVLKDSVFKEIYKLVCSYIL